MLKRLADARRDGDRVYAVIRGTGVAGDGRAAGLVDPDPGGQTRACGRRGGRPGWIRASPARSGCWRRTAPRRPRGTRRNSPRWRGLRAATGDGADRAVIGSVKSMIGHTMPAAGVAGLVKAALAIHHGLLLPTLHCDDPHPALAATLFRPIATAEPWETGRGAGVRRAAVNAFGFGGINAHVVLEQSPLGAVRSPSPPSPRPPAAVDTPDDTAAPPQPAAATPGAAPHAGPRRPDTAPPADIPAGNGAMAARPRVGAPDTTNTVPSAAVPARPMAAPAPVPGAAAVPGAPHTLTATPGTVAPAATGAVAPATPDVTPGAVAAAPHPRAPEPAAPAAPRAQVTEPERVLALGAETPERLAAWLAADDAALRATAPASGRVRLGVVGPTAKRLALARRVVAKGRSWRGRGDVWFTAAPLLSERAPEGRGQVVFVFPGLEAEFAPRVDGVAEYFGLSPATAGAADGRAPVGDIGRHGVGVFAVGRLLDGALRRMGVVPDAVAGHSVGEWTAMVSAGLYSGAAVNEFLGSFDPDALRVPGLAFGVLGAPAERVLAALAEGADGRVVLSHDNAPSQSMVCGPRADVDAFVRQSRGEGVIGQVLPFQSGFHTPMLAPYLGPIRAAAERFELFPPSVPIWSGTTAAPYPPDAAGVRGAVRPASARTGAIPAADEGAVRSGLPGVRAGRPGAAGLAHR